MENIKKNKLKILVILLSIFCFLEIPYTVSALTFNGTTSGDSGGHSSTGASGNTQIGIKKAI